MGNSNQVLKKILVLREGGQNHKKHLEVQYFREYDLQFHKDCESNFIDDDEFDANALNNMDETSVYVDKPSNYTYAKKVNINQVSSGFKLPIHILVNRVIELPNFQPPENSRIY